MINILVGWLVNVSSVYNLKSETLHLTIAFLRRFLSYMSIERSRLQLLGTACMYIASKYEEIHPPKIGEFEYINDGTCSKNDIVKMESIVLNILGFNLSLPTCATFLSHFTHNVEERTKLLAMYFSDLSLSAVGEMHKHKPSNVAESSMELSRSTINSEAWPDIMIKISGIEAAEFKACFLSLHQLHVDASSNWGELKEIREKYSSRKCLYVGKITPLEILSIT